MPVENLTARIAQFAATSLAAGTIGLALLTSPCPAQTALVTADGAHPTRMENPVTTNATPHESARPITADTIQPFEIHVREEELVELRRRITATRWPDKETVTDQSQGVQLATMQELARYWATDYDWRKVEAKLNALPQFITEIDGVKDRLRWDLYYLGVTDVRLFPDAEALSRTIGQITRTLAYYPPQPPECGGVYEKERPSGN